MSRDRLTATQRDTVCLVNLIGDVHRCHRFYGHGEWLITHSAECNRRADAVAAMLADVWDDAAEATAEWTANNPGPSGIPHDPPTNPYEAT